MLKLIVRRKNMQEKIFFFVIVQQKSYDNYTFSSSFNCYENK